ncbi:MAG TPA: holo-ACP synthase [Burkholderiales bacterium]|nr:holo-ACP synthase [Burkholderiales bacterium]
MIYGIGTDIVSVSRIADVFSRHGERFPQRILSEAEFAEFTRKKDQVRFLAKRFAAKEAFSKALGLGMNMPMSWRRMGVGHDARGKPIIVCSPELDEYVKSIGVSMGHISITDEKDYAMAFVVLEKSV